MGSPEKIDLAEKGVEPDLEASGQESPLRLVPESAFGPYPGLIYTKPTADPAQSGPPGYGFDYLDGLEKHVPGVELMFSTSMKAQSGQRAQQGRAAILRMSQPEHEQSNRDDLTPTKKIVWERAQSPGASKQDPSPTESDSGTSETPTGLVFDNLKTLKGALRQLPRQRSKSEVPQFFEKQLIILEDLGREWVETIGHAFHIPPHVFAH
ncbi:hypothetical protein DHEL01_v210406 [Diaporthe helianthi]|uniref:Uncharacterized protein n=1 Tax=Diaporthe helianthi TaxID=158607 RepID=A0A2P5HLU1_DIAHE|nr:hypothetical protein DHEL01_v210406 [Diaporthe helianthi]